MRNISLALALAFLSASCGTAEEPPELAEPMTAAAPTTEADEAAVREALRMIETTWNAGDMTTNLGYVDEESMQLPPHEEARIGKTALEAGWDEFLAANDSEWHPIIEDMWVSGDLALVRGRFTEAITPKDGSESTEVDDKAVWVLRRGEDGGWRMLLEMWNPDTPLE